MNPIIFVGDTAFDKKPEFDDYLSKLFEDSAFSVMNFEAFLSDKQIPLGITESLFLDILKGMKCKVICVANNHSLDNGLKKLERLEQIAESAGASVIGTSKRPWIIVDNCDMKLGILNAVWTLTGVKKRRHLNAFGTKIKSLVSQIQNMKEAKVDKVVLVIHWGIELEIIPHPVQIQMARELVDAGADIIVGHHSHLIQPFGVIHEKPIYYSIGNFYIPISEKTWYYPPETKRGLLILYDGEASQVKTIQNSGERITYLDGIGGENLLFSADYASYFESHRKKKHIPPLDSESFLYRLRFLRVRFLSLVTSVSLFGILWKWLKPKLKAFGSNQEI